MEKEHSSISWVNTLLMAVTSLTLVPLCIYFFQWINGLPLHIQLFKVVAQPQISGENFVLRWDWNYFLSIFTNIIDWIEFGSAIFILISLTFYFSIRKKVTLPLIGMAYFFSGFINIFTHIILNTISQTPNFQDAVGSFVWLLDYTSITLFLTVSLITEKLVRNNKNILNWKFYNVCFVVGGLLTVFFVCLLFNLPESFVLFFPDRLLKHPYIILLLSIGLLVIVPLAYNVLKYDGTVFSKCFFTSVIFLIATELYSVFEPTQIYNTFGWIQILEVFCYLLPLFGAFFVNFEFYMILKKGKQLAQETLEAKMHFMGTISHQLRTPMNAILGFAQCLLDGLDGELLEQQKASISKIVNAGNHLMVYINDVLNVSLLEGKQIQFHKQIVDLESVINEMIPRYQETLVRKGLYLKVVPDSRGIKIQTDRERIRQTIAHLLSNAVKFTESGGITIKCIPSGKYFLVEVRDTGKGISPSEMPNIFVPYGVGNTENPLIVDSRGFGLALSKKIIEDQGGYMKVESELGKGSCFTIAIPYLPIDQNERDYNQFAIYLLDSDETLSKSINALKTGEFCYTFKGEDIIENLQLIQKIQCIFIFNHLHYNNISNLIEIENGLFCKGMQTINLVPQSISCDFSEVKVVPFDNEYEGIVKEIKKVTRSCAIGKGFSVRILGDLPYENVRLMQNLQDAGILAKEFSLEDFCNRNILGDGESCTIFLIHFPTLLFPKALSIIQEVEVDRETIIFYSENQSFVTEKEGIISIGVDEILHGAGIEKKSLLALLQKG